MFYHIAQRREGIERNQDKILLSDNLLLSDYLLQLMIIEIFFFSDCTVTYSRHLDMDKCSGLFMRSFILDQ